MINGIEMVYQQVSESVKSISREQCVIDGMVNHRLNWLDRLSCILLPEYQNPLLRSYIDYYLIFRSIAFPNI